MSKHEPPLDIELLQPAQRLVVLLPQQLVLFVYLLLVFHALQLDPVVAQTQRQVQFLELFDQGVLDLEEHLVGPKTKEDQVGEHDYEEEHEAHVAAQRYDALNGGWQCRQVTLGDIRDKENAAIDGDG